MISMNKFFPTVALPIIFCLALLSCSRLDEDYLKSLISYYDYWGYPKDEGVRLGIKNAWEKAEQFSTISWIPLEDVPGTAETYLQGSEYHGVLYSSVKEIDTYIGLDVSFYTFLTAVQNPFSLLYSENIKKAPYHGVNCAAYYGTVCSSTVDYVLGIMAPYSSSQLKQHESISRIEPQKLEALKPLDLVIGYQHVFLVIDVLLEKETGDIKMIKYLESNHISTYIFTETPKSFLDKVDRYEGGFYRYNSLEENTFIIPKPSVIEYNTDLCPNKGDEANYRVGEPVIVNILSDKFNQYRLYEGTRLLKEGTSEGKTISFDSLQPGRYSIQLFSEDGGVSRLSSFIVSGCSASLSVTKDIASVSFTYEDEIPEYVSIEAPWGAKSVIHILSKEEAQEGRVVLSIPNSRINDFYCKVHFRNEYGRVTNKPIHFVR